MMPTCRFFVNVLSATGYVNPAPRAPARLGLFSHDGNIIGGALLGAGMALSGSCPGTVLAQVGVGLPSGLYSLQGAVLGGILWSGFLGRWIKSRATTTSLPHDDLTIYGQSGVSKVTAFLGLEALFVIGIYAIQRYAPLDTSHVLHPVAGGLLIGLAQLMSLVLRKSMLGVSTSYEEIGDHIWWLIRGEKGKDKHPSRASIVFSAGAVMGAWALVSGLPSFGPRDLQSTIHPLASMTGGLLICLGARTAGGCTSGHGISGVSVFSTASFITVVSMFSMAALASALSL